MTQTVFLVCSITESVSSLNINNFTNCTEVNGFIEIRADTFTGGSATIEGILQNHTGIAIKDLENMKNVRKVTGYVFIQQPSNPIFDNNVSLRMKNLTFLKNLEIIDGRNLIE